MARTGRLVLVGYPHHVVQRGHNRQPVFYRSADYQRYLGNMRTLGRKFSVRIHAWCLMSNHVHLLLTPTNAAAELACFMKALAARTTRYRNRVDERSGTLWESRYRSSPVQTDRYLLACTRYIELNPVRAAMVTSPEAYRWSSFTERMGLVDGDLLEPDPAYLALAQELETRRARYQRLIVEGIGESDLDLIRSGIQRGLPTGEPRFRLLVAQTTGRVLPGRRRGRPRKGDHRPVSGEPEE